MRIGDLYKSVGQNGQNRGFIQVNGTNQLEYVTLASHWDKSIREGNLYKLAIPIHTKILVVFDVP